MALCVGGWPDVAGADVLHREAQTLMEQYRADLNELATWCTQQGLAEQSRETLDILGPSDPYKLYIPNLPREVGPPVPPADASAELSQWYRRLQQIRAKYGSAFYDLAQRAVRVRPSLAYELALTAIRANPDHEAVRRIFGFQKYMGEWRTGYEVGQFREVDDPVMIILNRITDEGSAG